MKKLRNISLVCLMFFITIIVIVKTATLEIPKTGDEIKLNKCELSEEYIKWQNLSDEEKQKTMMPMMCKYNNMEIKKSIIIKLK